MAGCLSCQVPYDRYLELSLFVFSLLCFEYLGEDADQWSCSSIGPLAWMTKLAAMIYCSRISTWHTTLSIYCVNQVRFFSQHISSDVASNKFLLSQI